MILYNKNIIIYGTFDLYHIGHENILKRARNIANDRGMGLIVGVTDPQFDIDRGKLDVHDSLIERINSIKKTGYADLIIVESYVGQKIDDIKKYNVDSIIFGSDWEGQMDYLNEYCNVIYLPRTEGISSTLLRQQKRKTAIITGGSSDIGIGIIKMLLDKNYKIYATYNSTLPVFMDKNVNWIKTDLTDNSSMYEYIKNINEAKIDCIICNAGMTIRKSIEETTDTDVLNIINTNFISHFILIRELKPRLNNDAKIIFTGSQMGIHPHSMSLLYGTTKSMIHAFSKNLVKEFENTNITVNTIVPGFIETRWQENKPTDIKQNIYNKTALHRFGTIDEIVKGYKFCLENDFINGSLIEINGGYDYK